MPFFPRDDNDFTDGSCAVERAQRMSQHRFAGDYGEQFIESHALAATAGDDEGA